ncbi:pseudouridine synthase [Paenibacillus sp. JX-17]|uniref:Pseudouridine synthase n=1 Tax=Paenibacillus lacisoli TaxID=3064525 RepID=A0ABT9CEE0_9BACL|nr:pseudouridine synthase [Paenibacillus sp. JX-17]MDO7907612.1 pseudouridine synthase [Paenibacillus sp. JX-17]
MRIHHYISRSGHISRRTVKRLIDSGEITVNGVPCDHNTQVLEGDEVLVSGQPLPEREAPVYLALNKPVGVTCTAAGHVENNIIDFVNYPTRIFAVGRLDKASEGLILLTNDGQIVNKMMRSEHGHEKEYRVTVNKPVTDEFLQTMAEGVEIMNTWTKPCITSRLGENEFRIVLTQGMNRQIRRMSKALGYRVERLERVRIMNITLDGLPQGEWRYLHPDELELLLEQLG